MSLLSFHRFLITTAIVFCGGYAAWEFVRFSRMGAGWDMVLGVVFTVLTLLLLIYFNRMAAFLGYRDGD